MKLIRIFHRHIVIDEEREELAKNIADHEDEAEHHDREEQIHDELAADEAIDQFHRLPFVSSVPAWQVALGVISSAFLAHDPGDSGNLLPSVVRTLCPDFNFAPRIAAICSGVCFAAEVCYLGGP